MSQPDAIVVTKPCYTTPVMFTSMTDELIIDRSTDDIDGAARCAQCVSWAEQRQFRDGTACQGTSRRRCAPEIDFRSVLSANRGE